MLSSMDRTIEIEVTDNEGGLRRVRIATAEKGQGVDADSGDLATFQFCADDYHPMNGIGGLGVWTKVARI